MILVLAQPTLETRSLSLQMLHVFHQLLIHANSLALVGIWLFVILGQV